MKPRVNLLSVPFLFLSVMAVVGGDAGSRLEIKSFGQVSVLRLQVHAIRSDGGALSRLIVPDHLIQTSSNLRTWETIQRYRGILDGGYADPWETLVRHSNSMAFFRVLEQVNLPGADLANVQLRGRALPGAHLMWADLRNADLRDTDLSGASLRHADLRGAKLSGARLLGADLCYADLSGAELTLPDLESAALLNTRLPDGTYHTDAAEAEMLALESSDELLPPVDLYLQIRRDLDGIRAAYTGMRAIRHRGSWHPGRIIARTSPEALAALNASELGPVASEATGGMTLLRFPKNYHPVALTRVVTSRFGMTEAQPIRFFGDGDYILFDLVPRRYTFSQGQGDCPSGCLFRSDSHFTVAMDGTVTFLGQSGTQLPTVP